MALRTLVDVLTRADAGGYALGAFNVDDVLQAEAVLDAARTTGLPAIIETLAGASPHGTNARFWRLLHALIDDYPDVDVALHLDHGPDIATCRAAIEAGFTSVMIDGSLAPDRITPATFEQNVAVTTEVVAMAHAAGVSVEGELGTIGGVESMWREDARVDRHHEVIVADPEQAAEFVERTGVDALAVAIGTSHGAYKFAERPQGSVLRLDVLRAVRAAVPNTFLVLHGSSSLPDQYRERINATGGAVPTSWGVEDAEKVDAIRLGVRKINQGMDSHLAYTAGVRQALASRPEEVEPTPYLRAGREEMTALVAARMRLFAGIAHPHDA